MHGHHHPSGEPQLLEEGPILEENPRSQRRGAHVAEETGDEECAGGTIAFRSLLSGNLDAFNPGKLPTWIFLLDLVAAASIGAIAGLFALGRSPRQSLKLLLLGAALGAPVVIGGAVAYKIGLTQRLSGLNMIVATLIVVVLFVVVIGLISASANAIIGAFAAGLPDLDNPSTDPETPADAKPKANNTPPKPKPV